MSRSAKKPKNKPIHQLTVDGDDSERVVVEMSTYIASVLAKGLESHVYWEVTPQEHRNNGFSMLTHDADKAEDAEEDEEVVEARECEELEAQLEKIARSDE